MTDSDGPVATDAATSSTEQWASRLLARNSRDKTYYLCLLCLVVDIPWLVFFGAMLGELQSVEALDPAGLAQMNRLFWLAGAVFAVFALIGRVLRARDLEPAAYPYAFFTVFSLVCFWVLHYIGTFSSPGLTLFVSLPPLILLIYGQREGLYCLVLATLILLALSLSEYFGLIGYAAAASTSALSQLYLSPGVFGSYLVWVIGLTWLVFFLVWVVRGQLIEKESALGRTRATLDATTDRLAHAGRSVQTGELATAMASELDVLNERSRILVAELLDEVHADAAREELQQVHGHLSRTQELLLELGRLSRQQTERKEPVNLNALVSDALAQVRGRHPDAEFDVEIALAPELPKVLGGKIELLWMIDNLIERALPHLGAQAGRLQLRTVAGEGEVVFACAWPSKDADSADFPFVYRVVARHNGRLSISDGSGEARVEIILPAH